MQPARLDRRERMLSIWVQGRLGERETVNWGISTIRQARGVSRKSTLDLFEFLEHSAQAAEPPVIYKIWRLLSTAVRETRQQDAMLVMYHIREKIQNGALQAGDIDEWLDCLKPRLVANSGKPWRTETDAEEDPNGWVHWSLKTTEEIGRDRFLSLSADQAGLVSDDFLFRLVERGTSVLADALSLAKEIGWIEGGSDVSSYSVHRVFPMDAINSDATRSNEGEDEDDPDQYNDGFAPLVRTLASALHALDGRSPRRAARAAQLWRDQEFALFRRLYAFAAWSSTAVTNQDAREFLASLRDEEFWLWSSFPEMATLRAIRWNDLLAMDRNTLEERLRRGPSGEIFSAEADRSTLEYYRDHEFARLVDNKRPTSSDVALAVHNRRERDKSFPRLVPIFEPGLPGPKVGFVPDGDANAFVDTPLEELLQRLDEEYGSHHFDRGDNAEAFASTATGKLRIIAALERVKVDRALGKRMWSLLLSFPHTTLGDNNEGRASAESICRLALELPESNFSELADRLSYWLDATDEKIPNFDGAETLWRTLLPFAVDRANNKANLDEGETDLTTAALNEPLGHLLSLFFRRCPTIPANKSIALPQTFVLPLKSVLEGRANELIANRICILIRYFFRVEPEWVEDLVLTPMARRGKASERLWEAFSKYARIPQPEIWRRLEAHIFRHLTLSLLSPDAKKRLAEMCAVVWVWTKRDQGDFGFQKEAFRLSLELADDAVRGAVASQFSRSVGSYDASSVVEPQSDYVDWKELVRGFFREIWPLEPALQSPTTANDFAKIPARVGINDFADAVRLVLPYLLPFEIWSVQTELWLDMDKPKPREIVTRYPNEVLTLLSAVIGEEQLHGIYDIKNVLDFIVAAHPNYKSDLRLRALRKVANQ
jgi:hypothetical protein